MKAVFVVRNCLLRGASEDALSPEVAGAMRELRDSDRFVVLLGAGSDCGVPADNGHGRTDEDLVQMVSQAGGRIDALVHCPHADELVCDCWGEGPGLLLEASRRLDIRLDESYLICDAPQDVHLGYAAGCRTLLVLAGRSLEELFDGYQPEPADFPSGLNLARVVDYVATEDEASAEYGHPRPMAAASVEETEAALAWPGELEADELPTVTAFSPVHLDEAVRPVQVVPRGARLLLLVVVGGIWVSLGIAYMLTHLYRVAPFPDFVWYLTLQFIPRPIRGGLFILTGALMLLLALRIVRRSGSALRWGRAPRN